EGSSKNRIGGRRRNGAASLAELLVQRRVLRGRWRSGPHGWRAIQPPRERPETIAWPRRIRDGGAIDRSRSRPLRPCGEFGRYSSFASWVLMLFAKYPNKFIKNLAPVALI